VLRGGFGINTVDLRWKERGLQQFDEYQALNRTAARARRSDGAVPVEPGSVAGRLQRAGDSSAAYVGTNYGSRNASWLDPNLHPGYVMNWNATVEYQINAKNLLKGV